MFKGNYNLDEGLISQDALEVFKKYETRLGGKCHLFLCNDPYSRNLQISGNFNCIVFFPSGDIFYATIVKSEEQFILKSFSPGNWETEWMEIMRESKQN